MPYAGYSGPIPSVNLTMIAYPGTVHFRAGKRTAQRYTYASYFPTLQYDAVQGLFFGGNFWDSRATGYLVRNPSAEQSQHPPVDPAEMGNPDTACITYKLSLAPYRTLFEQVWGLKLVRHCLAFGYSADLCYAHRSYLMGGSTTPVALSPADRTRSNSDYDHWAQSLNAFEHSLAVSPFTSKFDAFLAGNYTMTADEAAGFALFNGRGNCNSCHLDGRSTAPAPSVKHGGTNPGGKDTGATADVTPVFTCFGSANEGLPKNPRVAFYYETTPDAFGFTVNPGGFTYTDFGLGTFLRSGFGSAASPELIPETIRVAVDGQMQVSFGAQCCAYASTVSHHRGPWPLLPEGVLSQRLHQESEAGSSTSTTRGNLYPGCPWNPATAPQEQWKK